MPDSSPDLHEGVRPGSALANGARSLSVARVGGAFGYFGSKQGLALNILRHLPPHNCWVELFGGALAVTMAKTPAPIEVVNDLDDQVVNVFRQLRDSAEELIDLVELTPYAREELSSARCVQGGDGDLERARKFLVQAMMSVNGVMAGNKGGFSMSDTYTRGAREARVNRWRNYPDRLKMVTNRLRDVRIEKRDGVEMLAGFSNKPATLVYIDPPYLTDRSASYNVDARDQEFHERLLSQALLCRCMILISGYTSETYTQLLEKRGRWRRVEIRATTRGTTGRTIARQEVLWMNRHAEKAWQSGRVRIALTPKEKKEGRVNPPRGPTRKCRRIWRTT